MTVSAEHKINIEFFNFFKGLANIFYHTAWLIVKWTLTLSLVAQTDKQPTFEEDKGSILNVGIQPDKPKSLFI